jgi:hypothetical protein
MSTRVLSFVLLAVFLAEFSPNAWAQAAPSGESSMLTPPPVSVDAYPKEIGSEERLNYFRVGLTFRTAYIDNLYAGSSTPTISETIYSILPTIAFDQTTHRRKLTVTYNPGFSFYHPSSALNEIDQIASVAYSLRLTPHVAINAADGFRKTSTSFDPTSSISGGSISGSAGSSTVIILPFTELLTNKADGSLSYQFSPTGMIGISGSLYNLHYPNLATVPGLYDSAERGGGFFYSHRITDTQYIGAKYRYARTVETAKGTQFETQTQTVYFFYTIYLKKHLSLSVSGGPQYYETTQTSTVISSSPAIPNTNSWAPAVATSMGWQGPHTNFVAGYERTVTSGGGLLGTFNSNSAVAIARWQMLRKWTSEAKVNYSIIKGVNPFLISSTQGGHTIAGSVRIEHPLSDHFDTSFQYDHLHQSYSGVPAISANPDSNRFMGSISWQFARPLGR